MTDEGENESANKSNKYYTNQNFYSPHWENETDGFNNHKKYTKADLERINQLRESYKNKKPISSKSSKSANTVIGKFKYVKRNSPGYLYLKEIQRMENQKRYGKYIYSAYPKQRANNYLPPCNRQSKTANGFRSGTKYTLMNNTKYNSGKPKLSNNTLRKSNDKVEESHQRYLRVLNSKSNPYSTYWSNKILERNYGLECGFNGYFLNGVPVLGLQKKKKEVIFNNNIF
ncbi:MAG: hypothetical protein MJ252_29730 [archaeon]|nr:hypothetical protein [archaeon]